MMKKCKACGKQFDVLYPELWRYKIHSGLYVSAWFCSWKCLRAKEKGKEENKMGKISDAQKEKAIQIAIENGDPIAYLKECGSEAPAVMWYSIKKRLKKEDTETYALLPEKYKPKQKEAAEQVPVLKVTGKMKIETPEANAVEVAETPEGNSGLFFGTVGEKAGKPENLGHMVQGTTYEVSAIRVPGLGEFYYDRKYRTIDWRGLEGDEVSMNPEGWRLLQGEIGKILDCLVPD